MNKYLVWKLLVYWMALWPWLVSYNPFTNAPYYPYDSVIGSEPIQDMILTVVFLIGVAMVRRTWFRLETAIESLKYLTDEQKRQVLG